MRRLIEAVLIVLFGLALRIPHVKAGTSPKNHVAVITIQGLDVDDMNFLHVRIPWLRPLFSQNSTAPASVAHSVREVLNGGNGPEGDLSPSSVRSARHSGKGFGVQTTSCITHGSVLAALGSDADAVSVDWSSEHARIFRSASMLRQKSVDFDALFGGVSLTLDPHDAIGDRRCVYRERSDVEADACPFSSSVIGYFGDASRAEAMTCLYTSAALSRPDNEPSLTLSSSTLVKRVSAAGSTKGSLSVLLWNQLPRLKQSSSTDKLSAEFLSISEAIIAVYRELALRSYKDGSDFFVYVVGTGVGQPSAYTSSRDTPMTSSTSTSGLSFVAQQVFHAIM